MKYRAAKAAAVLTASLVVTTFSFPVLGGADQWVPTFPSGSIYTFTVSDNALVPYDSGISAFAGPDASGVPTQTANEICSSITSSGPCDLAAPGTAGAAQLLLPECTSAQQDDCVAGMSLGTDAADLVASTPTGMTLGQTTPGDSSLGLPTGSTVGLWTNPLANSGGTTTYSTSVAVELLFNNGHASVSYVAAAIDPYKETADAQAETPYSEQFTLNGLPEIETSWGPGNCAWEQTGECGQFEDFPPGTVGELSIRAPTSVGGWFSGRLHDPSISESVFDPSTDLITVTAGAVTTPTLALGYSANTLPASVSTYVSSLGLPTSGFNYDVLASNPQSFTAINELRDAANNTASGQISVWNFATIPTDSGSPTAAPCLGVPNQVDGFVSTNSMIYQGSAPTFSNGAFNYQVAGLHYNPDGSVTQGTYDLNIRDSVAQCLYNFTNAPISASVSVTEDSAGDQNVATTTVSDSNGWLHVGAYGFNFSNPTIKVRLTQKSTKVTLICVKGKQVRRVVTTSRKCPKGYTQRRTGS